MNIEDYFRIYGTYELKNGLYNVIGDIELIKKVNKLPVKFGSVTGNLYCSYNEITTLEGCPTRVGGSFSCLNNKLTSLKGSPIQIGGIFICDENLHNSKEYKKFKILEKLRS